MRNFILAGVSITLLLTSCSTYKATRTPDDVYYSPAKQVVAQADRYEDYSNSDDHYLRMKVRNRYQWDGIDDYSYWNDSRYDFGYSCFPSRQVMINPYLGVNIASPYYYRPWGTWYNPMYTVVYYKTPRAYFGNTSKSNLLAYRNTNYNSNNRQTFGSLLKGMFNNNNNNYNNNDNNPTRSFNTTSTPSNSAGGRSGGMTSTGTSTSTPRPPR